VTYIQHLLITNSLCVIEISRQLVTQLVLLSLHLLDTTGASMEM
jgi:hypothetical protein